MAVTTAAFGMGQNWAQSRIYASHSEVVFGAIAGGAVDAASNQRPQTFEMIRALVYRLAPVFALSRATTPTTAKRCLKQIWNCLPSRHGRRQRNGHLASSTIGVPRDHVRRVVIHAVLRV